MSTSAYPLSWPVGWQRAKHRNRHVPFSVTPDRAVHSLYAELRKIGATHVVVSSNAPLRNDGTPYRDALSERLDDPGVAVYFQRNARPMVMAQDAYSMPYANIRSLALAIEAMRAIERHGGGHMMERSFDGFAQLPPPAGSSEQPQRPWREVLDMQGVDQTLITDFQRAIMEDRYRKLAKERHPDKPGGSHDAFAELNIAVQRAREELGNG